jgi:epoxyqueuosine reductase
MNSQNHTTDYTALARTIKSWSAELGFDEMRVADTSLDLAEKYLQRWLSLGRNGEMTYMARHGTRRTRPSELVPGTIRVLTGRMDYLPQPRKALDTALSHNRIGYISRYALGRDYHKLIRKRLQKLAERIETVVGPFGYRAFVDSAPVMEKALAEKSGLGWIGKHTNVINKEAGSWFFLGELYTDLPLPVDDGAPNHCGSCQTCIDICPTGAIVAPYELDARRCISYLTIELRGSIPEHLRAPIGNRIYGCDDCQIVCPWNRFARLGRESGFSPRSDLLDRDLAELARWSEREFLDRTEGSAIRRIGYACWQRNIAVALGNAETGNETVSALEHLTEKDSVLVREHAEWGLKQHRGGHRSSPP